MYIFKYHPDNNIYRNGIFVSSYADFMTANPDFPLEQYAFFEYRKDDENGLDSISSNGNHSSLDITKFATLINAIKNLG